MDRRKRIITFFATLSGIAILFGVLWGLMPRFVDYDMETVQEEIPPTAAQTSITLSPTETITTTVAEVSMTREQEITLPTEPLEEDIRMFLFLGTDRTEERDKTLGIYRSDAISILRLDMNSNWAKVLSIPRDTYAYLPIRERYDKINHAYAFGSLKGRPEASVLDAVNLFIDDESMRKYFAMEMEPIGEMVDMIGGVEVDVEVDMKSHGANLDMGRQVLYGEDAYDYVHWRYSGDGDIGRIRRQQQFAKAALNKVSKEYGYVETVEMIYRHSDHFNTNIHIGEMTEVMEVLSNADIIEFNTIPGKSIRIDGIYYWQPYENESNIMIDEFLDRSEE